MSADERHLLDVAMRVSDGDELDWDEVERTAGNPRDREMLKRLRLIHGVAGVCREDDARERWGQLDLLEKLDEGAFGEVYRARDRRLDREVALKLLRSENGTEVVHEARLMARVRHDNVVAVHGADEHDGRVGIWMELVSGRTLADISKEQGPMGAREAALIGIDLCRALAAVHAAGLLHRDVKARNVMRADGGRIVLTDFSAGVDRSADDPAGGTVSGTPLYMAPELLRGEPATRASDTYSLGVLLYHLTTGSYPMRASSVGELREMHRRGEARLLRDVRPGLSASFVRVVEQALGADPSRRFASAGEMERALEATLGVSETRHRRRWMLPAVSLLIAALAVVGWWALRDPAPAGRYSVQASLVRLGGDGSRDTLAPGDRLALGDRVALELRGSRDLWVYVVNEDEQGHAFALFPLPGLDLQNPLPAAVTHALPGSRDGIPQYWGVDTHGGKEHLLILASPERQVEFERELSALATPRMGAEVAEFDAGATGRLVRGLGRLLEAPDLPEGTDARRLFELARALGARAEVVDGVWFRHVELVNPAP